VSTKWQGYGGEFSAWIENTVIIEPRKDIEQLTADEALAELKELTGAATTEEAIKVALIMARYS